MATEHYFVALDVEKQSCGAIVKTKKKNQKDQAMDLYKNKLAVCYKTKKKMPNMTVSVCLFMIWKKELSETYDYLSEKETNDPGNLMKSAK